MGKPSNLTPEQRTKIVLAASILARRYGVSAKTISGRFVFFRKATGPILFLSWIQYVPG